FQERYGFSPGITGLTYLGVGLGFTLAILFGIPQIDKQYRRLTARNNAVPMPEFRLPVANVGAICIPVSLLWYGWSVQAHTYFLVPIIGTSLPSLLVPHSPYQISHTIAQFWTSADFRNDFFRNRDNLYL